MSTALTPSVLALVLVSQLGAPRYRDRVQATQALYRLTPMIIPHLEAARGHDDAEVSQRSASILAAYYKTVADRLVDQVRPTRWPRMPWLDMLPKEHPKRQSVIDYYLQQAQEQIGRKAAPDWSDYRLATQLYMRQLFLDQNRPKKVQQLLDRMADSEQQWLKSNGKRYSPPLKMPRVQVQTVK